MASEFLDLDDDSATAALGQLPAEGLQPGDFVLLEGDLGAGKTTFARGMLRALGESGPVRSPTYGLLSEYHTPRGRVVHMDLYRMRSPAELAALGLDDLLPGSLLWLVEWPEKGAGGVMPAADALLRLVVVDGGRRLHAEALTEAGRHYLHAVYADTG